MLIKHGDGKVLSVIKSSEIEDLDQEEIEKLAIEKLKKTDLKNKNTKLTKKEQKENK